MKRLLGCWMIVCLFAALSTTSLRAEEATKNTKFCS